MHEPPLAHHIARGMHAHVMLFGSEPRQSIRQQSDNSHEVHKLSNPLTPT